jgi:peroxiredoxin
LKHRGIILAVLGIIVLLVLSSLLYQRGCIYKEIAAVNSPAPDFELEDTEGKTWKLSSLRGKVVFISFWGSWCPTCKMEMPYKKTLVEKMQGKPFQMLGILYNDDPPADAIAYIRTHGVNFPTLKNPGNKVAELYGLTGVPESFIIDKNGIIRKKVIGSRQWDSPEAISLIEKWL